MFVMNDNIINEVIKSVKKERDVIPFDVDNKLLCAYQLNDGLLNKINNFECATEDMIAKTF